MSGAGAGVADAAGAETAEFDVVVVGGGAAGLSAALNLARARRRTLVVDANRPRNAATLRAHGFLTRDGISPLELRALGRAEVSAYQEGAVAMARVESLRRTADGRFEVAAAAVRGGPDVNAVTPIVLLATGLHETLPDIPNLRGFYGTALHSCFECDGYEKREQALAFIGESADLATRAVELCQWTNELTVFSNGSDAVTGPEERALAARGIRVERRWVVGLEGHHGKMTGIRMADGELIGLSSGFVRPVWDARLDFLDGFELKRDPAGLVAVDSRGRTSVPGLYAAGDVTAPGPQQLIVAAGEGAHVAAAINRDLIGPLQV